MMVKKPKPKIPPNQAELLRQYRKAYEKLPRKNLKTIQDLRKKFEKLGMVI